jgi:hypothetical protein
MDIPRAREISIGVPPVEAIRKVGDKPERQRWADPVILKRMSEKQRTGGRRVGSRSIDHGLGLLIDVDA